MRVFIVPSWCPTREDPLSGTFFVEQARALAAIRKKWTVAISCFDLASSRVPWRPWQLARFMRDWQDHPPLRLVRTESGLYEYEIWTPHLPGVRRRNKWQVTVEALYRQLARALSDYVRLHGLPDLIHAHAVYPGGAAAVILGSRFNIPVALSEHLGPFPPPTLMLEGGRLVPLISDTYAKATEHSAVSNALARKVMSLGLAKQVTVIPNFLHDGFGSDQLSAEKRFSGFSMLSVGGPSHAKGTDVLLNAFAKIDTSVVLSIAGSSDDLALFKKMAADLAIGDRVHWLGNVPRADMPALYGACDAFVLPSRGETFGVSLIEALACGKPIIATRCGGPEDIVTNDNGILVPVDDVEALAVAMGDMVRSYKRYSPIDQRRDFLARFSATAVVEKLEHWYRAAATIASRDTAL